MDSKTVFALRNEAKDLEGISKLIDDFEKEHGYRPHLHVDAAHGGGFVLHDKFNPKKGGLLKGIERADSITIDPHKMLYTHYSAGCILFKNKKDHKLLKQDADYLFKNDEKNNLGQYRVEGSMGIEGSLQTHASLFFLGKKGYQVIQEHTLRNTEYLAKKIKAEKNFEICNEPEMNILCFRYCNPNLSVEVNDEINKKAQKILYDRGNVYIANDKLLHRKDGTDEGRKIEVFRSVIMHPYTTRRDIDVAVKEVKRCVSEVINEMKDSLSKEYKDISKSVGCGCYEKK